MAEAISPLVHQRVGEFRRLMETLPADERREKALYHLERLRMAFDASHQEAVRFAAYTLNKTVRDAAGQWPPETMDGMEAIRAALREAGHQF
jgi:hypothetical protein